MNHRLAYCLGAACCLLAFPERSPAPLIYRPEEGWTYEKPGADTRWQRSTAKEQLQVAQTAFDKHDYSLATKASKRVVTRWPFANNAPQAQYLLARCYEAEGKDEIAFKQYQKLLEKYPKMTNATEVLQRQFVIANKFLAGQWRKLLGYVPLPPSMDATVELYEKLIKDAPYSEVAPQSQMNIGAAREKQKNYAAAVKAYEKAADRYSEREQVMADAMYKAGLATIKECKTAEYDQNAAGQAINKFTDFAALFPNDPRVPGCQQRIDELRAEQARGSFQTARFYEKKNRWKAALIYYNETVQLSKDPNSSYAKESRQRIAEIEKRIEQK